MSATEKIIGTHEGAELPVQAIRKVIDDNAGKSSVQTGQVADPDPVILTLSPLISDHLYHKETNCWAEDIQERVVRTSSVVGVPLAMLTLMNCTDAYSLSKVLGIAIFMMFTMYFLNLVWQLHPALRPGKDAHLFKVNTRLCRVNNWAAMRIANTQLLYHWRPIQSISEFSAISGGQANHMIANLGPISWVGLVMMYGAKLQCSERNFQMDIADFLAVIGVVGIVVIGFFELNSFDRSLKIGHYVGVAMAICNLFAALLQGYSLGGTHLVMPILCNVIAWPCFLYWNLVISTPTMSLKFEKELELFKEDNKDLDAKDFEAKFRVFQEEQRKEINTLSIKCIAFEGTAIYFVTVSFAWFLFQWGDHVCEWGCGGDE